MIFKRSKRPRFCFSNLSRNCIPLVCEKSAHHQLTWLPPQARRMSTGRVRLVDLTNCEGQLARFRVNRLHSGSSCAIRSLTRPVAPAITKIDNEHNILALCAMPGCFFRATLAIFRGKRKIFFDLTHVLETASCRPCCLNHRQLWKLPCKEVLDTLFGRSAI